jgi:hypothetical protein
METLSRLRLKLRSIRWRRLSTSLKLIASFFISASTLFPDFSTSCRFSEGLERRLMLFQTQPLRPPTPLLRKRPSRFPTALLKFVACVSWS